MPKRSKHDRAIRGYPEYHTWKGWAEFLETEPTKAQILHQVHMLMSNFQGYRIVKSTEAMNLVIFENWPELVVMERIIGKGGDL